MLQRNDLVTHEKDNCVQRIVNCEHCKKNFKFCELTKHLKMCPKVKVSCDLKCGVVMCRDKVTQHIDRDCKEKEIECPFVKYKCVGLIKRQDLSKHLEEKETEHLKLKLNAIEDIVMKQSEVNERLNETITDHGKVIEKQNRKIKQLYKILEYHPIIKFHWRIGVNLSKIQQSFQKEFDAIGYLLQFNVSQHNSSLLLDFCLKDGLEYDKLDWPFRSKFITIYSNSPIVENVFKSEVIEVQRGDLASKFSIAPIPNVFLLSLSVIYPQLEISVIFC